MTRDRCNCYFLFWAIFCPQNKNFKKLKKKKRKEKKETLEISFYTCVPKIMIICYTIPEIW